MNDKHYYQSRINKAVKFLNQNLGEELRIQQLAEVAHFSTFHFQRIYKALQNETPYETLLRLRLEKAVFLLKNHPSKKVSDIAYECGFSSIENFSRQFKGRFKCSPSAYRKDKEKQNSRIYQEENPNDFYPYIEDSRKEASPDFEVSIEHLEAIPIALIRALFGEDGSVLVQRYLELIQWAEDNQIPYQGELTRFGMSIDSIEVTPASIYRYDFALRNPNPALCGGLIEQGEIPAGLYATVHCQGSIMDVAQAWDHLYKHWLPSSSYVPLHYPAIEEFIQGPEEIGWENFNIKCRVPITKPLER